MKKLILLLAVGLFAFNVNAQGDESNDSGESGLYAGVNVGIPLGDIGDWKFAVQVDFGHDWEAGENLNVGVATGYGHIFGGDFMGIDLLDYQYIPLAGTVSLEVSDGFNIDADLGYAIGIGDVAGGGFYYRPGISYDLSGGLSIKANYTGISDDGFTGTTVTVGTRFRF